MIVIIIICLTDYAESEGAANFGLRADLTLVDSRVSCLRRADLEGPFIWAIRVKRLKPLVVGVRQDAHRQDVEVALPDPWHLEDRLHTLDIDDDNKNNKTLLLLLIIIINNNR